MLSHQEIPENMSQTGTSMNFGLLLNICGFCAIFCHPFYIKAL